MHRRASHAILIHRRGLGTSHRECAASHRVAGPCSVRARIRARVGARVGHNAGKVPAFCPIDVRV